MRAIPTLLCLCLTLALTACGASATLSAAAKARTPMPDAPADDGADTANYSQDKAKNYNRTLYVAQDGDDTVGLDQSTADAPVRSLARVNELLRNSPSLSVAVLFKRGDTWAVSPPTSPALSVTRPNVLLGVYGVARDYAKFRLTGDGQSDQGVINVSSPEGLVVHGLSVYADNPVKLFRVGINVSGSSSYLEFNDVVVNGFYTNIVVNGAYVNGDYSFQDVVMIRAKILNSRTVDLPFVVGSGRTNVTLGDYSSSSGIYIIGTRRVRIYDSLFANNGNQLAAGNARPHYSYYNHQIYFNASNGVDIQDALIQRSMFIITFPLVPLWVENNVAATKDFSAKASPWPEGPDGIKAPVKNVTLLNNFFSGNQQPFWARRNDVVVEDNVFFDTRALSKCAASTDFSVCFSKWGGGTTAMSGAGQVGGTETLSNSSFKRNLMAHRSMSPASSPMSIKGFLDPNYATDPRVRDNVIYDWNGGVDVDSASTGISAATWSLHNEFTAYGSTANYPDSARSLTSYPAASGSAAEFVRQVGAQPLGLWTRDLATSSLNNYFRAGFGMPAPNN